MCPLDIEPEVAAARAERAAAEERARVQFDEGVDGIGEDFVLHTPPRGRAADVAAGAVVPDASDCDERVILSLLLSAPPARGPVYSLGDGSRRRQSLPLALHFVEASDARASLAAVRSPTPLEQDLLGLAAQQAQQLLQAQAQGLGRRGAAANDAVGGGGATPRAGAGSAGSAGSPSGRKVPPPPPARRPPSAPPSARVASSGTTPRQAQSGRVPPLSAGRVALTSAGGTRGGAADAGPLVLTGRSLAAGGDPSGWDSPPHSARPLSSASETAT